MTYDYRYIRRHALNKARYRFLMAYCAMFILAGFLISFFAALMAAGDRK